MSMLLGLLNITEAAADRTFVQTIGQRLVYDAVSELLNRYNADLQKALGVFVERTTTDHKLRYKLPGGGRLEARGGFTRPGMVKATGQWDVAFPLYDYGAGFGGDEIAMAYMTAAELDRHVKTIMTQDTNTVRFALLKALLNSSGFTYPDDIYGDLSVVPLANGDSVVYPPVIGSESEAADSHYLGSNYTAANISDTNNPIVTIVAELEEHFGYQQGNSNVVVFIHRDQTAKVSALTDFEEVGDRFIRPGDETAVPTGLPKGLPGRVIGRCSGAWIIEWSWVPTGYMIGIHLDAPKPVMKRVDPPETGLGNGRLQLVAKFDEWPLEASYYRHRFGFGVGNRLSAVCVQLVASTSYTTPTAYA